jgi:hypothetical protein
MKTLRERSVDPFVQNKENDGRKKAKAKKNRR